MRHLQPIGALCLTVVVLCVGVALILARPRSGAGSSPPPSELTPWESEFGVSSAAESVEPSTVPPMPQVMLSETMPVVDPLLCAGLTRDSAVPAAVLPGGVSATAGWLCAAGSGYLAGSGIWTTVETRVVPAERIPAFISALSTPMKPFTGNCAGIGYNFPGIVVALSDGSKVFAAVPDDGCAASQPVLDQLAQLGASIVPTVQRVSLIVADRALITGCLDAKPFSTTGQPGSGAPIRLLPEVAYSVCVYDTDTDTRLISAGPATAAGLASLRTRVTTQPPAGCGWPTSDLPGVGSFVSLAPTPTVPPGDMFLATTPYPLAVLTVATTGCHVVINEDWDFVGWVDDATVAGLLAGTS